MVNRIGFTDTLTGKETGEHFFVQEVNLWKANQTAHLFFQRPFYKCSMNDAEAEMYGYDTY